jgi:uncharacterized protein
MSIIEFFQQPWHWAPAGVIIGLTVPALLIMGNKQFGISSNLQHVCAACIPADISYFKYDWKQKMWSLFYAAGIILGGFIAAWFLSDPGPVKVAPSLAESLARDGITDYSNMIPVQIFNWDNLLSLKGLFFFITGGFLVGFGTRYADGCTSGHSINGLANLQLPSLIATIAFMVGGFISANLLIPFLLKL